MATTERATDAVAAANIDKRIAELGDWRGRILARVRQLIHAVDPDVLEEWKWRGVPVWSHDGIICTGESYKDYIKLTFARGAALPDPKRLFNASLDGNVRRAIDFRADAKVDDTAFKQLVRAAVDANVAAVAARQAKRAKPKAAAGARPKAATAKPKAATAKPKPKAKAKPKK